MARERVRVYAKTADDGRTKQADTANADINTIMKKWINTGTVRLNAQKATYGDFSKAGDYHTAMNKMKKMDEDFMSLPSAVRRHVEQSPEKFLDMVYDPERRAEMEELGLVEAQVPESAPAAAATPAPGESPPPTE